MKTDKFGFQEPEVGEVIIWKDPTAQDDDWVVEYSHYEGITEDGPYFRSCYPVVDGLKNAIIRARERVKELKHNLEYAKYQKEMSHRAFFLVPDSTEYLDVTEDADAIQVLFQYDNYR